ncbi:MAG: nickel-dependent hydrogenase large subunit [Cyanobacteria bacterium]|nr:nickel-dependent hydrogenase large subunit [Cyanobacteriota bacterium]
MFGDLMGWAQLARVAIRNFVVLAPKGRRAAGAVRRMLGESTIRWRGVEIMIGLQSPGGMTCNIFVPTDAELSRARSLGIDETATRAFREALVKEAYPPDAIATTRAVVHSDEEIARTGYQYWR